MASQSNATPHQSSTSSSSSHIQNTQFRAISRNNSNTSTASSSNKGDLSSTISTSNSVASSRSQLSKQLIDHRQLLATCGGSSTPIRSFQRATISSVVKTRAFDNNPVLQGLLVSPAPSGPNSVSNSQTPSPHTTPIFSRSRSLRMSGGPHRYQQATQSYYRTSSRTPELYSFNSGDIPSCSIVNQEFSQAKLTELSNEKAELKESLEFLECERQVLIDSVKDLRESLQVDRSQRKKELENLKKQLTDAIAARIKAESQLMRNDMEMNDIRLEMKKLNETLSLKDSNLDSLKNNLEIVQKENNDLKAMNKHLGRMLTEKLKYNGLTGSSSSYESSQQMNNNCMSIVTEMAKLRIELDEKDKIIEQYESSKDHNVLLTLIKANQNSSSTNCDIENLNNFLDETVECIKGWPEELASSSHVQNLMKTLLKAHRADQAELSLKLDNVHL